ncbi:MAG: putative response regulator, CheY [Verrucomicrobiales bacterium]|nr:putative response regulator, CheY [Verrucomicrobiales bacterium]
MIKASQCILLVEDNDDDVFFMKQAMTRAKILNPMRVATSGQEAIDYLSGTDAFADRTLNPLPFLILLDLKLPYVPGLDVLKWVRSRPELKNVLIVVLTSSREDRDIDTAYTHGANSYIVKPPTADKLNDMVKALAEYWTVQNQPPIHISETPT